MPTIECSCIGKHIVQTTVLAMDSMEHSCQALVLADIALMKDDAWVFLGCFATSLLVRTQDINLPVRTLGQSFCHSKTYSGSCGISLLIYITLQKDMGDSLPPVMMAILVSAASVIVLLYTPYNNKIYSVGY